VALKPGNQPIGGITLMRAAIQSPNFVTGVSGWSINQNGSAEFNNITVRNQTIIDGQAFFYLGTPGPGTLDASIADTAGTDQFGNAYLAGITTYSAAGVTNQIGSVTLIYAPTAAAGNLIASISDAAGTDQFGNAYLAGITDYNPTIGAAVQNSGAAIVFFNGPAGGGGPWTSRGSLSLLGTALTVQFFSAIDLSQQLSVSAGSANGLLEQVTNATSGAANSLIRWIVAAATDAWLGCRVSGDVFNRITLAPAVSAGGAGLQLGTGAAAVDTNLYRAGIAQLKTDGELDVAGILKALAALSVVGGITADTEAISSSQAAGGLLTVTNTHAGVPNGLVQLYVAAAADPWLRMLVTGDTFARISFTILAGGGAALQFGTGAAAVDTNLYRAGIAQLKTDGELDVAGILKALAGASVVGGLLADTVTVSSGQAAGGLLKVTNTTAGASNALAQFFVAAVADSWLRLLVTGDTSPRIVMTTTAGGLPIIQFGSGAALVDTNLYRAGAALLKTDSELDVGGILKALAAASVVGGLTADTAVISSGVAGGNILAVTNTTGGGGTAVTTITAAAAGDAFQGSKVSGDSNSRITLDTTAGGLPRVRLGSGAATPDVTLERLAANSLGVLTADLAVDTAGRGLQVKEGSNAKQGTAVLVGGTLVVANTSVTASSRIFLCCQVPGGTPGFLRVSARTAGTSFTILSSSSTDTSTVAYQIFEPAP